MEKVGFRKRIKRCLKWIGRTWLVLNLIGFLAYVYTWLVGKTGKFEVHGIKELEKLAVDNHGAIMVAWHGRALMLPFFRQMNIVTKALVSPHYDGRIIARLLKCYHIYSIDGSSDRNAARAAVEIVKELNKGSVVSVIPDGPRGPRMRLNKSVIYFAQKTGKPIIGLTYSSEDAGCLKRSWDAMLLPKLFKKGIVLGTKPMFVPKNISDEEMEKLRQQLEDELNMRTAEADRICHVSEILPGEVRAKHG